jgi:hypothetical protein
VQRLLSPSDSFDSSKRVTAGVILSAFIFLSLVGWNQLAWAEGRMNNAQTDAKPSGDQSASKSAKDEMHNEITDKKAPAREAASGVILRGKEALIRVVRQKPEWGKEIEGLQIGLSRTGDKVTFKSNEVVPLEFYIRNNSDKQMKLTCYRHFTNGDLAPAVFNAANRPVATSRAYFDGADLTYDVALAPHETIVCEHDGLKLSEIDEPSAGSYSTEQQIGVFIGMVGDKKVGKWTKFETGKVSFEIAPVLVQ